MYRPISAYHHLVWNQPPIWNLDSSSLDWIGPLVHAQERQRKNDAPEWLSLWLSPHWCPPPWWCWPPCSCSPPMATPLQVRTLFILCLRFACMLSQSLLSFLIFHSIFNSFLILIIRGSSCPSWLLSRDCSSFWYDNWGGSCIIFSLHYAAIVAIREWKIYKKQMARFYSFFDQILFVRFLVMWKCKYLTRKILFAHYLSKI